MANDNGNLIFNTIEYFEIIDKYPDLGAVIKNSLAEKIL